MQPFQTDLFFPPKQDHGVVHPEVHRSADAITGNAGIKPPLRVLCLEDQQNVEETGFSYKKSFRFKMSGKAKTHFFSNPCYLPESEMVYHLFFMAMYNLTCHANLIKGRENSFKFI
jgi:hypothetical protein